MQEPIAKRVELGVQDRVLTLDMRKVMAACLMRGCNAWELQERSWHVEVCSFTWEKDLLCVPFEKSS